MMKTIIWVLMMMATMYVHDDDEIMMVQTECVRACICTVGVMMCRRGWVDACKTVSIITICECWCVLVCIGVFSVSQLDTRKYLECFDFESRINTKDRDRIVALLRTEVRKAKLEGQTTPMQNMPPYDVYKMLVTDSEAVKSLRKKPLPEWEQWEHAHRAVVAAQQLRISQLLTKVQDTRQEVMSHVCGACKYHRPLHLKTLRVCVHAHTHTCT